MAAFLENLMPSVHDTLTLREALSKLAGINSITLKIKLFYQLKINWLFKECERQIKHQGVLTIIDNFNIVYSCL